MKLSSSLRFLKFPEPAVLSFYFSQVPGTGASLILKFFFKYLVPGLLWFWFIFSNARNQWFFGSDFFFRMPATSGSLILIYSFECPQPVVITTIKDKLPHWSIPENESKLEPEWAGEGPFCKVTRSLSKAKETTPPRRISLLSNVLWALEKGQPQKTRGAG
jgi:hypothetical protein